jgi:hypothetical protein
MGGIAAPDCAPACIAPARTALPAISQTAFFMDMTLP